MTQTIEISVVRALATLKSLKKEIDDYMKKSYLFQGIQYGTSGKDTFMRTMDAKKLESELQSNYDQGESLINRYTNYKQAILNSNAVTMVQVNGRSMSVSDAIVMKATLAEREKFLSVLRKSSSDVKVAFEKNLKEFEDKVKAVYEATVNPSSTDEEKSSTYETIRNQQMSISGPIMLDPIKVDDKIKKLEEEINFLKTELDYVLSTSNVETNIMVLA